MPLTSRIRGPWFVPDRDETQDLNRWSQSAMLGLGQPAHAVARCTHCGDMVFATAEGWALVSFASARVAGGEGTDIQSVQHFSCITDIGDAMAEHDA